MEAFTTFLAKIFGPVFRPMSRWLLSSERRRPTWHYEGFVVGMILLIVAAITSPYPETRQMWRDEWRQFLVTWLSMFAVFGSFLHAKVGYRMSEAMKAKRN